MRIAKDAGDTLKLTEYKFPLTTPFFFFFISRTHVFGKEKPCCTHTHTLDFSLLSLNFFFFHSSLFCPLFTLLYFSLFPLLMCTVFPAHYIGLGSLEITLLFAFVPLLLLISFIFYFNLYFSGLNFLFFFFFFSLLYSSFSSSEFVPTWNSCSSGVWRTYLVV